MDLINGLLTPEITGAIRLFAIVAAVLHLLIALRLFQQAAGVNRLVHAPHGRTITALGVVHLLFLAGILLIVILY